MFPEMGKAARAKAKKQKVPSTRACYQITLPRSHLVILSTEADLWGVGKGDFLTMLLRRKCGELVFERPKDAPAYSFSDKEFLEAERYGWYLPNQDVPKLEADRLKMGNVLVSSWVVWTLNEWIGRPGGVGEKEMARRLMAPPLETFLPKADTPAEPYWAIFEVDEDGNATGNIWAVRPMEIVLFKDKAEAEKAIRFIAPAPGLSGPKGKPGVAWSVRGVTFAHQKVLQIQTPGLTVFEGTVKDDGQLLAYPIR
jgi:hypothetical protein